MTNGSSPTLEQQRSYYDGLWVDVGAAELNNHERSRFAQIAAALSKLPPKGPASHRILEVGCGRGWLSGLVLSHRGDVRALDLSPESIEKASAAFPNVEFEVRDILTSPPPDRYDLIVSSEVIEHVPDQRRFVDVLLDSLAPGGYLLLTTPNARLRPRWDRRSDFRPQPIEQWLDPQQLQALVARRCELIERTTFFFDVGRGWPYSLINSRVGRTIRRRWGGQAGPIDRLVGRLGHGLYAIVLGRVR